METFGLEVEEEVSTVATQTWADGAWIGKSHTGQKEAWLNQVFEVQTWRQLRGPAGAVMCETRDLGIKWPQWQTLTCERASESGHEIWLPKVREEDALETCQVSLVEEVGSEARVRRNEGKYMA